VALTLTMLSIGSCVTAPSDPVCWSLPLTAYSPQEQMQILAEKDTLPPAGIIRSRVLPEFSQTRDAIRACRSAA
jgi:hypothetical protein